MADNEAIIKARVAIDASDVDKTKEAVKGIAKAPPQVEIRVEPPEPVEVPVVQPEPVEVPVVQPEPVEVPVVQPEPVEVPVVQPEPVEVAVNEDAVQEAADGAAEAVGDAAARASNAVTEAADEAAEVAENAAERTGDAAEKAAERVGGAAKDAARSTANAAASQTAAIGRVRGAIGQLSRAAGLLKSVLAGFGVVGAFSALAAAVGKVRESFGAAKKESEELAKAKEKAEHAEAVEALAKSYERLAQSMRRAADEMRQENELEDLATKNERALEDAQNERAKQNELSAIGEDDPLAAEKRARVEARYAAIRNQVESRRRHEDVEREIGRLRAQSDGKSKEAEAIEDSLLDDDAMIREVRQRLDNATRRSTALNAKDNTDSVSQIGSDLKNIVTLNWGRAFEVRTEEGDRIRDEARAEAEQFKQELKRLEEQRKAKQEKADSLRSEAANLGMKADASETGRETALELELAGGAAAYRGERAAKRSLERRERQMSEDRQTASNGREQIAGLEQSAEAERARAQAAAEAYMKEQLEVVAAQNRYDMLVQNGGSKKEKSAALAALQKENADALEAQHEMEKVAAEVANVLKAIREEVGTLSRHVKAAQCRLKQNEADAPEG